MKKLKRKMLIIFCLCFAVICCALPFTACTTTNTPVDGDKTDIEQPKDEEQNNPSDNEKPNGGEQNKPSENDKPNDEEQDEKDKFPYDKVEGTAGLEYTLSDDGEYYYLSGLGSAKDKEEIVVGNYYNGKPVTQIGKYSYTTYEEVLDSEINTFTDDELLALFILLNSNVKSITVSEGITTLGAYAFAQNNMEGIENISLPKTLSSIGFLTFSNCTSLKNIDIPDGVKQIGYGAFGWCTSITNIKIPDSVIYLGGRAFMQCTTLTSVYLGNGINEVNDRLFEDCIALNSVTLKNGITIIGEHAFHRCSSLMEITIPTSVTKIKKSAFYRCLSLTSVIFKNTNGWCCGDYAMPSKIDISSEDLSVSAKAAELLNDTYAYYEWERN